MPSKTETPTRPSTGWVDMPLHEAATKILERSVHLITGRSDTSPRPGQIRMIADMAAAMSKPEGDGQALMEAPTGSGKSATYLTAAAASWATTGKRSVVSTESLALQAQITDKDAPVVIEATRDVTGLTPKVAVLKGWGNYACTLATVDAGNKALEDFGVVGDTTNVRKLGDKIAKARKTKSKATLLAAPRGKSAGILPSDPELLDLVEWSLEEIATGRTGDKNAYPGALSDSLMWEQVSVASTDCIGADKCPFAEQCLPRAARQRVVEADIVVTNHTLLGVQAANDIPVVIGSKTLGTFDHLFVDEAHGLPSTVRSQGSVEVSGRAIRGLGRAMRKVLDESDKNIARLTTMTDALSMYVEDDLREHAKKARDGEVVRLHGDDEPLPNARGAVEEWTTQSAALVKTAMKKTASGQAEVALRRLLGRITSLAEALELVSADTIGGARWTETVKPHSRASDQTPFPVARYTPVDVAPKLRYSIYTRDMTEDEEIEAGFGTELPQSVKDAIAAGADVVDTSPEGPKPRVPLSVVALSATLPNGFSREMGLRAAPVPYASPFDAAYGGSVLFVPRASSPEDIAALGSDRYGRVKFDTTKHRAWAMAHIVKLVEANGGSALVLAATASSGREYAAALEKASAGRWNVLSQWGGQALRRQVADWKADTNAVLVGTKSLMTGVDASGETCTLVVVDRPPRAASNPVDDARVEQLVNNAQMDKWSADRLVYVSDAGLLLEQAAGRLIRSISDSGMVAVLDPRLLKSGPFSYQEQTRQSYLGNLRRFERKVADPEAAYEWLRQHRAGTVAKAG